MRFLLGSDNPGLITMNFMYLTTTKRQKQKCAVGPCVRFYKLKNSAGFILHVSSFNDGNMFSYLVVM